MEILDGQKQTCLFGLIENGAHELALEFLKGDNHFTKDELSKSLISACQHGYKFIVQMLVRLGADVNYRGTNANTPLLISVQNSLTDIVKFLLTNKADVNASNSVGDSALILSIRPSGSTEITENLLKQPAINIDDQNQDGYTAIMKAAEVKDVDALKILLDKYCNIHSISASQPLDEYVSEFKMHEHTSNSTTHYVSQWTTLEKTVNSKGENVHQIAERCGIGNVVKLLQEHISKQISPLELAMRGNDVKSFNIFLDCDFVYASDKSLDEVFLQIFQTCSDKDVLHFNKNEIAMIKALLEHGADVNITGLGHHSVFYRKQAISHEFKRSSSTLFPRQRSLYCKNQIDPIIIAAESGCVKVLELLLSFEADANRYDFPNSPLHIALSHGHADCAKLLIQHGANLDCNQALKLAVDLQDPKYVEFLIENCKNELTKELKYMRSPIVSYKGKLKKYSKRTSEIQDILLSSVRKGNLEIIGHILDLGANINIVMDSGTCPLAESKNGDVAKLLIDRGANVNYTINHGAASSTPLITVVCGRKHDDSSVVEVIQVLLENGASVNDRRSKCGENALMLAASKEGSRSVLQLLLDHGAKLSERDREGNTALIHAVRNRCPQNVLFLLQFITDRKQLINVQNNCGFTALMYAVMERNKSMVGQLIDQGADVNIKGRNGDTALHILLGSGKHENGILTSLIQAGCDVNCQNNKGISPLMLAAEHCLTDTISVLLDSGAEINAVSNKDATKTALAHLLNRHLESHHFSCLEYLLDRGASSSYVGANAFHKMIAADQIEVIPKLIRCGFGPASIKQENISSLFGVYRIMPSSSPLLTALYVGNAALSRFFVGNMFLTHSDVSLLSHNKLLRQHLERKNYKECLDILNELSTQPMTLFNLSFVRVSTAVGATPGREVRVNKLPVPQIIKDKLLFKLQDVELTVPEKSITDLSLIMTRFVTISNITVRHTYRMLAGYSQTEHYSRDDDDDSDDPFDDFVDSFKYDFLEDDYNYFFDSD